jgi:TolA-binding protein
LLLWQSEGLMMALSKDTPTDRIADATARMYESLESRLTKLDSSFEKLKDEMRIDLRSIDGTVQGLDRTIQRMQGENVSKQVEENKLYLQDLEKRLRVTENFQNNLAGRLLIIGAVATLLAGIISTIAVKLMTLH